MSRALVPQLTCSRHVQLRKIRELPVQGTILVKKGQKVRAEDPVARALLPGELHILRVPERMGLEPFEIMKSLRIKEGDTVEIGDVLCLHPGPFGGIFSFLRSEFKSPCAGTVELITELTGHVGIREAPIPLELNAYVSGKVVEVDSGKSVTIETHATMLQGIFGVGGERLGRLKLLAIANDAPVQDADIPVDVDGKVLVGGMSPSAEALLLAQKRGALGFVTGSIDDSALKQFLGFDLGIALTGDELITMSLVITEGFGKMPLSERVLSLLKSFDGETVSINGATQVRAGAQRPEVIIREKEGAPMAVASEAHGLEIGSQIRIIRVPYFGKIARVVKLPSELQKIESGAETRVLYAEVEGAGTVCVPRANVEVI